MTDREQEGAGSWVSVLQRWLQPGTRPAFLRWLGMAGVGVLLLYFFAMSLKPTPKPAAQPQKTVQPAGQGFSPAHRLPSAVPSTTPLTPASPQMALATTPPTSAAALRPAGLAPTAAPAAASFPLPPWLLGLTRPPGLGATPADARSGDFKPGQPPALPAGAAASKKSGSASDSLLRADLSNGTPADGATNGRSSMLIFDKDVGQQGAGASADEKSGGLFGLNSTATDQSASAGGQKTTDKTDASAKSAGFLDQIAGKSTALVKATKPEDLTYKILEGKLISGVLETPISTDLPGLVRALIDEDVYGEHGRVVLLPRMTRLVGEYQSVVRNAQARILIVWRRAIRPDGSTVAVGSFGTDSLGRAGLGGEVDNHYGQRYGAAILVSWIGTALSNQAPSQTVVGGDGTSSKVQSPVAKNTETLAAEIIRQQLDIPPTITVDQGTGIKVFVARDLDFSVLRRAK